jgi:CubicO group peptidase (beta-lactamase class C family)
MSHTISRASGARVAIATILGALSATSFGAPLSPLAAQAPLDARARVDAIFAPWDTSTSPGCAVDVARDGTTLLERAYGMADLEHGIPNSHRTVFEGGSLSKQFTSAAVVLLAMDGKLSLDDDVRTYVPEVPDYGKTIRLRHLMTHTSGLRDWGSVAGISGWGREERSHTHDDVLDIVSRQSALNFDPGHEYSYSNTGYNLLAITVSRVSGIDFAEFSRERIFAPLGLRNTEWRDDYRRIVPGRSSAYDALDEDGWEINRPIEHVHGNGGILTTVGDLRIWAEGLTDGRLGGPEFVRLMHERGRLNDGSEIVYAAGLRVWDLAGVPAVTHTGSTAGYRAFLGRYPEQGLSVAMLCNASNVPTAPTGGRIARIFLGEAATDPQAPPGVQLSQGTLERLRGLYADPVTGFTKELRLEDGALFEDHELLVPTSDTELSVGASSRRYVFDEGGGGRSGLRVEDWQYTDKRYEPVDAWSPTEADLRAYVGTYYSPDAETTYLISVEGGALEVWQRPGDTHALRPAYEDAFRMGRGGMVRFRRDSAGQVTGLSLSLERVYDMRFERVGSGERPD